MSRKRSRSQLGVAAAFLLSSPFALAEDAVPAPPAVPAPSDEPAPRKVVADSRDRFTLFEQRLLNRQLADQLRQPGQEHRVGKDWGRFAYAVDAEVGSVQKLVKTEFSRFHGYFVLDNFASLTAVDGLDLNLNLPLLNPSASDGYRVSSYALPGGGLHFHQEFDWAGHHGRVDAMGTDLDVTTLGAGLLLEHWPIEGEFASLDYGDLYLRQYFAGRVFWPDDDVFTFQLGALDGAVEGMLLGWKFGAGMPTAYYADVSSRLSFLGDRVGLSAEVAAHLRDVPRLGALGRADYLDRFGLFSWHVGYQFRWYQREFGPYRGLRAPTTTFNLPFRAEGYATNSFAYFGASEWFEQWSHTLMAETELPLGDYFRVFGEGELWARFARDDESPLQAVSNPDGALLPGTTLDFYYRAGLRLYPFPKLPHRLSTVITNKQVATPFFVNDETTQLFEPRGHYVGFLIEAAL